MRERLGLGYVAHVGGGALHRMHQSGLGIDADMRLHAEMPLIAFLRVIDRHFGATNERWSRLMALIEPHYPKAGAKGGRPPKALSAMLRIHFMQQWFNLSNPGMEEALHDMPVMRSFAGIGTGEVLPAA